MAHERYTRTNQKLYFAGLALASWRRLDAQGASASPGAVQAEREACLFHLYGALLGLCHEIAGYYRLPNADLPQVELLLGMTKEESPSPELRELMALAGQSQSWLAQLLAAHAALFQPPRAPARAKNDPGVPLIPLVGVDETAPMLPADEVEAWRQQLKDLVLRYREALTEQ